MCFSIDFICEFVFEQRKKYWTCNTSLFQALKTPQKARHFTVAQYTGLYGVVHRFESSQHFALNATLEYYRLQNVAIYMIVGFLEIDKLHIQI